MRPTSTYDEELIVLRDFMDRVLTSLDYDAMSFERRIATSLAGSQQRGRPATVVRPSRKSRMPGVPTASTLAPTLLIG